jgi:hypothetical protein
MHVIGLLYLREYPFFSWGPISGALTLASRAVQAEKDPEDQFFWRYLG